MSDTSRHTLPAAEPIQDRARQTYEKLLSAAQSLLAKGGFQALNSNAIAREAGVTPPAFYRYFSDKHAVLLVLCKRMMARHTNLAAPSLESAHRRHLSGQAIIADMLRDHTDAVRTFPAGLQIMILMRALPELKKVRLKSHTVVADLVARNTVPILPGIPPADIAVRSRVAMDMFYGVVEMLLETGFADEDAVIEHASHAIAAMLQNTNAY
jgi:AcrR family transcriptional regulator